MQRILVVRNDKIGDFMLAWPSFAMLKASCDCHVTALVPSYTAPLARLCPWIDDVILDPGVNGDVPAQRQLKQQLQAARFDAAIALFSNGRNAWLLWQAGIRYRLAPATKWAQFLFNHRLVQRRSRSQKPEFEYNLDLIRHFLRQHDVAIVEPAPPYMQFDAPTLATVRAKTAVDLGLEAAMPWMMVHAGTGGSATNLSMTQYAELVLGLQRQHRMPCVVTAGPGEEANAAELQALIQAQGGEVRVYHSRQGLDYFCQLIANAALFIAGSTGPLHIAAALDVPTVGFFPARRSATPLRWQPLNSRGRHLAFTPPAGSDKEKEMSLIAMPEVLLRVNDWLAGLH